MLQPCGATTPSRGELRRRLQLGRSVGPGRVGTDGSAASRAGRSVGPSRPEICVAALRAAVGRSWRTESETQPAATRESVGNYAKLTFQLRFAQLFLGGVSRASLSEIVHAARGAVRVQTETRPSSSHRFVRRYGSGEAGSGRAWASWHHSPPALTSRCKQQRADGHPCDGLPCCERCPWCLSDTSARPRLLECGCWRWYSTRPWLRRAGLVPAEQVGRSQHPCVHSRLPPSPCLTQPHEPGDWSDDAPLGPRACFRRPMTRSGSAAACARRWLSSA